MGMGDGFLKMGDSLLGMRDREDQRKAEINRRYAAEQRQRVEDNRYNAALNLAKSNRSDDIRRAQQQITDRNDRQDKLLKAKEAKIYAAQQAVTDNKLNDVRNHNSVELDLDGMVTSNDYNGKLGGTIGERIMKLQSRNSPDLAMDSYTKQHNRAVEKLQTAFDNSKKDEVAKTTFANSLKTLDDKKAARFNSMYTKNPDGSYSLINKTQGEKDYWAKMNALGDEINAKATHKTDAEKLYGYNPSLEGKSQAYKVAFRDAQANSLIEAEQAQAKYNAGVKAKIEKLQKEQRAAALASGDTMSTVTTTGSNGKPLSYKNLTGISKFSGDLVSGDKKLVEDYANEFNKFKTKVTNSKLSMTEGDIKKAFMAGARNDNDLRIISKAYSTQSSQANGPQTKVTKTSGKTYNKALYEKQIAEERAKLIGKDGGNPRWDGKATPVVSKNPKKVIPKYKTKEDIIKDKVIKEEETLSNNNPSNNKAKYTLSIDPKTGLIVTSNREDPNKLIEKGKLSQEEYLNLQKDLGNRIAYEKKQNGPKTKSYASIKQKDIDVMSKSELIALIESEKGKHPAGTRASHMAENQLKKINTVDTKPLDLMIQRLDQQREKENYRPETLEQVDTLNNYPLANKSNFFSDSSLTQLGNESITRQTKVAMKQYYKAVKEGDSELADQMLEQISNLDKNAFMFINNSNSEMQVSPFNKNVMYYKSREN